MSTNLAFLLFFSQKTFDNSHIYNHKKKKSPNRHSNYNIVGVTDFGCTNKKGIKDYISYTLMRTRNVIKYYFLF